MLDHFTCFFVFNLFFSKKNIDTNGLDPDQGHLGLIGRVVAQETERPRDRASPASLCCAP